MAQSKRPHRLAPAKLARKTPCAYNLSCCLFTCAPRPTPCPWHSVTSSASCYPWRWYASSERRQLSRVATLACDTTPLPDFERVTLAHWFEDEVVANEWRQVEQIIGELGVAEQFGGVNPGDRRAVYTLIRQLRSRNILEIGTHIGSSTVAIAAAQDSLRRQSPEVPYCLTTVDLLDVNDPATNRWEAFGSPASPRELLEKLGFVQHVEFVVSASLEFFDRCEKKYDFIFLDGSHCAPIVYQEIPAAIGVLAPGGWILLHDFFPGLQPLWTNGSLHPGPPLAVARLQGEGAALQAVPLGRLPWPTKLGSNITSLALLAGA